MVKTNIIKVVKEYFRTGIMPDGVNETSIILIPKIANPVKVSDFRPISLCNVVHKIMSKMSSNRLRKILPEVSSPTQSAFIWVGLLRIMFCCPTSASMQ